MVENKRHTSRHSEIGIKHLGHIPCASVKWPNNFIAPINHPCRLCSQPPMESEKQHFRGPIWQKTATYSSAEIHSIQTPYTPLGLRIAKEKALTCISAAYSRCPSVAHPLHPGALGSLGLGCTCACLWMGLWLDGASLDMRHAPAPGMPRGRYCTPRVKAYMKQCCSLWQLKERQTAPQH